MRACVLPVVSHAYVVHSGCPPKAVNWLCWVSGFSACACIRNVPAASAAAAAAIMSASDVLCVFEHGLLFQCAYTLAEEDCDYAK